MNELAEALAQALEDEGFRRSPKSNDELLSAESVIAEISLRNAARNVRAAGHILEESKKWRAKTATERARSDDEA